MTTSIFGIQIYLTKQVIQEETYIFPMFKDHGRVKQAVK